MARITALPLLASADVDGGETLPVVKGGTMMRTPGAPLVERLAAPFISQAQAAAAHAEAASGPTYESIAAGMAQTADGGAFAVANADGTVTIYLRVNGSPVGQRTLATAAALRAGGGAAMVGFRQRGAGAGDRLLEEEARETVKISQFYAGGASDSVALQRAYQRLTNDATGGIIELDVRRYDDPYLFDALALEELNASGTNPITIRGKSWATPVRVASACARFISMGGAWSSIENLLIQDPTGLCSEAYIYSEPKTGAPSLERLVKSVKVIGPGISSTASLWVNNGGHQLRGQYLHAQNVQGLFWNRGGGVDSQFDALYGLGIQHGIRLDANEDYGHAENLQFSRCDLLCTRQFSRGIKITDALDTRFTDILVAQMGGGSVALEVDGVESAGAVLTQLSKCYFEGSSGGLAMRARGTNRDMIMIGGGFGQGGWSASDMNLIDFDGSQDFVFNSTTVNFPGAKASKVATFANSSGTITESNKGWGRANQPSTETNCDIDWGLREGQGLPAVRSVTSSYPNGAWTPWTPNVSALSGDFGALGAIDCAYRRQGKSVDFRVSVAITSNGTAAVGVFVSLPIDVKSGIRLSASGTEDGLTDKGLKAVVIGNGATIKFTDGTYPGGDGAVLVLAGTYEVG